MLIQAVKIAFVCLHSHFQLQDKCQSPGVGRGYLVEAGLPDQLQVHNLLLKIRNLWHWWSLQLLLDSHVFLLVNH